jgi:RNA polymerase sigma-70 factor (ECF subfamily)
MHDLHGDQSPYWWQKPTQALLDTRERSAGMSELPGSADQSGAGPSRILAHLSRLPVEQREVLMLVAVERLAYAEIATILEAPIGTILARLNRAREAMRLMANESAGQ